MRGWECVFLPDIVVDAFAGTKLNVSKEHSVSLGKSSIQCATKTDDIGKKKNTQFPYKNTVHSIQLTRHIDFL